MHNIVFATLMFAAVHLYVRALLVLSDFTPPEQITEQVAQSIHARDYHVTVDYVCNICNKEVDRLCKRAERDVDSVLAAVCAL
jgi:23S rRNA maturation mini-RNase III